MAIDQRVPIRHISAAFLLAALMLTCLPAATACAQVLGPLIFKDTFSGPLDQTNWDTFITNNAGAPWPWLMQNSQGIPSSALSAAGGYVLDYDLPSLIFSGVPRVGLNLQEQKGSGAVGYSWSGSIICSYPDTTYFDTAGFTFTNAYVDVRAKMPPDLRDGGWPAIWFLAAPGSGGPEIDLQEGGFLDSGVPTQDVMHSTLWYPDGTNSEIAINAGESLSAGYHDYAMAYMAGSYVDMYLDGKLVASWTSNVPTSSYYIIINNTMASSATSSWHSQVDHSTPSPNELRVQYVKVYALALQPTITALSDSSGLPQASVTITGTNFVGVSSVAFGAAKAKFHVDSDTSISATVPPDGTSGPVVVTTSGGTAKSAQPFTYQPASITSFSPATGRPGTVVKIAGEKLAAVKSIMFGGVPAAFTPISRVSVTATVPAGASTGPITVTTAGGAVASKQLFTVS